MENNILNNQEIARKIIEHYYTTLKSNPNILKFLTENHELTREELEKFKIGYSDNTLNQFIPQNDNTRKRIIESGFINSNGSESFKGCITFPVIDINGIFRDMICYKYKGFKKTEKNRIKYLKSEPFIKVEENIKNIIEKITELRIKSDDNTKYDGDLFFQYGERTYRIRGLNTFNISKLKVNLTITREDKTFIDTIDLYSSRSRKVLINQISEIFEEENEIMTKEIGGVIKRLDEIRLKMKTKNDNKKNEPPQINKKEKENIITVLKKSDLLKMIKDDLTKIGIAGEEKNKVMLYMVFTSRKLRKPMSVIVKGDSAGGKSYLVNQVLRMFPDEDIKNFTEVSAKSLFYMSEDELENKILVIFERHGSIASDYSIRSLQSEEKLQIAVTMRDPKTSEFKTIEKIVRGPISYVETTTQLSVHPENQTRMFDLYIDESEEQTKKIFTTQDLEYLPGEKTDNIELIKIKNKHHLIQRILEPVKVVIPYVRSIVFPTNKLRLRRDRMRFLALIETFAFLYQFQRKRTKIKDEEYIIADIDDYRMAYELVEEIMAETLSALHKNSRKLLNIVYGMNKKDFTVSDIQEKIEWTSLKVRRYIKQLIEEDYIEKKTCGQGKRGIYCLCGNKKANKTKFEGLITPLQLKLKISSG